jgi:S1-C subfamily serine protease
VSRVDWIALAIAAVFALSGLRRGLVATALSLAGAVAGAVVGARLAPHLLHGGSTSPYTPIAGLVGAVLGGTLLRSLAAMAGAFARNGLRLIPPLRALDTVGGLLAGAALGLALVWVAGAVVLQLPGQPRLHQEVQRSQILRELNTLVPPRTVLQALARIDPFPAISGPAPPSTPPDTRVLSSAAVQEVRGGVVRITAVACGFGVEGSGWVARRHLVVTAAHVVAGGSHILAGGHKAQALVVDRRNDIAVLRVPGLSATPLRIAAPRNGAPVAILGYPENGPFDARAGRIGATADVVVDGALRQVTAVSGLIRHGNSGGPAVDADGAVEATIFAARIGSKAGYAIPSRTVRHDLAQAKEPVSTGSCEAS